VNSSKQQEEGKKVEGKLLKLKIKGKDFPLKVNNVEKVTPFKSKTTVKDTPLFKRFRLRAIILKRYTNQTFVKKHKTENEREINI
jgi:hypothetical protein